MNMPHDMAQSVRFVAALVPRGPCCFLTRDDSPARRPELTRTVHVASEQSGRVLHDLGAINTQGAGIFIVVNDPGPPGRPTSDETAVRALFVDLVAPDGDRDLNCFGLRPSAVVESSPGRYQAYWFAAAGFPVAEYVEAQRRLAAAFGGDPAAHDLAHALRMPGYCNRQAEPFMVRIVSGTGSGKQHGPDELRAWLASLLSRKGTSPPPSRPDELRPALASLLQATRGQRQATTAVHAGESVTIDRQVPASATGITTAPKGQPAAEQRQTWQPGTPVRTAQDHADWQQWRKDRKREQQRQRRATNRRIDFYPDPRAAEAINKLVQPNVGGDYSSVINRIVGEWLEAQRRRTVRQRSTGSVPPE